MSHIVSIKTALTDLEAIKATCKELGLEFVPNQRTYYWYATVLGQDGWCHARASWLRDWEPPEGFTETEMGHCEHAIRIPGCKFEIGLMRSKTGTGYRLMFDNWDSTDGAAKLLEKVGGATAGKFLQTYGINKTTIEARKMGASVRRVISANGAVSLHLTGGRVAA